MNYKIIEVHVVYDEVTTIAVLWQSNTNGWVRASYCTSKPCNGYKFLLPNELISTSLIQEVAGQGMNLPDKLKLLYFPGKKSWER